MTTTGMTPDVTGPVAGAVACRRARRAAGHAANLALAAAVMLLMLFVGTMIVASVTRHHFEQVITASMVPAIPVGSMVVTERAGVTALHVGDILVFPKPTNASEVIVHRIVQLTTASDGSVLVHTRGDANSSADPWELKQAAQGVADRAIYIVPSLGTAILDGRNALLIVLPVLLLAWLGAWSRQRFLTIVRSEA
jgi:signal peptidase